MRTGTYIWLDDRTIEWCDKDWHWLRYWLMTVGVVLFGAVVGMVAQ